MNDTERQLFSETYSKVFVALRLKRVTSGRSYLGGFIYQREEKEDAEQASAIAESTIRTLRAALTPAEPATASAAEERASSGGGFRHL